MMTTSDTVMRETADSMAADPMMAYTPGVTPAHIPAA